MALLAMAIPIVPGKVQQWWDFTNQLNGPRHGDYEASRRRMGVHERVFLQSSPQGDLAVVTFEGDDPEGALRRFVSSDDDFTRWFVDQVQQIHGLDLRQVVQAQAPQLVVDSERLVQRKAA